MPNFFSNLFAATPSGIFNPSYRADPWLVGQKLRRDRARFDLASALLADTVVVFSHPSGTPVWDIRMSTNTTSATGAINLGLYRNRRGAEHIPVAANLLDVDLFASAVSVTTAVSRVDAFTEDVLNDIHRGLPLWQLANVGGASFLEDPMEDWDIVLTFSTALADSQEFMFELEYVEVG